MISQRSSAVVRAALRTSTRAYATTPRPAPGGGGVNRKPATTSTSASELHPIPSNVKSSANSSNDKGPSVAASGNSTAPEDLSSRPSGPGPSAPVVDAQVAAPDTVNRAGNSSASSPSNEENWTTSFAGMSAKPFGGKAAEVLGEKLDPEDVEVKPDGLIYLPEIKYRRILTRAFGPGGWAMAPRGETNVGARIVSREWVLVCLGRYVSTARGEQEYFDPNGIATASEAAKSNALMRCCKDLGIASELWDPRFIREFKAKNAVEVWVEDSKSGRKRKLWRRKDSPPFEYPYKETGLAK